MAANVGLSLDQYHRGPGFARHDRRGQPGRTGADDDDVGFPMPRGWRRHRHDGDGARMIIRHDVSLQRQLAEWNRSGPPSGWYRHAAGTN